MNKAFNYNPEDLSNSEVLDNFIKLIKKEARHPNDIAVDLKKTGDINLSQFNSLVSLYVHMTRVGKNFKYQKISSSIQKFAELTRFDHVFNR